LTPTSDSLDSPTSACSEKTEASVKSVSELGEESVSDRIFRKSFYSRFNSLDRKKYGSGTAGSGTTSGIRTYSPNRSLTVSLPSHKALSGDGKNASCSSLSPKINKYNPNPLFKELITDEYKSNAGTKTDYSRRATSKLSKLLREIESDVEEPNRNGESTGSGSGPITTNGNSTKAEKQGQAHLTDEND
jgi:hypothetical protein